MGKEQVWSVMDAPRFDPWTTESFFDEGQMHTRDLYRTEIRLKKGSIGEVIDQFRQMTASGTPVFLKFYSPAGVEMTAEVRAVIPPEEQPLEYDTINLLTPLTLEQVFAIFPSDDVETFGY